MQSLKTLLAPLCLLVSATTQVSLAGNVNAASEMKVTNEVRAPRGNNDKGRLPEILLNAALERGGIYHLVYPYGDIEAVPMSTRINGVKNKELDIFYALTTPEYEEEFLPVYIPIYRGIMGMRLAIVKNSNKDMFSNVQSLDDLKRFSAGQGKMWADSAILEHNSLPVIRELRYNNLFKMLEADRFDYFPRGIQEPWSEVAQWQDLELTVDQHIMLWYKIPFYFFVHRSNPTLAKHLTEQIEAMIADGSFLEIFNNEPYIKSALYQSNIAQRTIIKLDNPFLNEKTPVDREELWYTPPQTQSRP
jgi:hypothetical protein